jgi:hypothetical protein
MTALFLKIIARLKPGLLNFQPVGDTTCHTAKAGSDMFFDNLTRVIIWYHARLSKTIY